MNRIGASALSTDKLRAMPAIASELETLPINKALFQTSPHQATVVGNTVERAELVGANIVTRGKMTAEMLEALVTPWAKEALAIEPSVDFRDRMKLDGVNRDFVPSSWGMYYPTWVDYGLLAGSFGVFLTLVLLFCRFLPTVAATELKAVQPNAQPSHRH